MLCFESIVVWRRDLDTDGMSKKTGRRMERVKWTNKIKNEVVLEGRIMLELMQKRKRNWLGHWFKTELPAE